MGIIIWLLRAGTLLALTSACIAFPVDTVTSDLKPLIREAADSNVQFAVQVPHPVSINSAGRWTKLAAGGRAEWTYAIRIPGAVSLSFHANRVHLPVHAELTVRGKLTTILYRSADARRGDLWSRVQPGESLEFKLSVPSAERGHVLFEIQSFQAGYRALGAGLADHPYYRQLKRASAAAGNAACVQNYECNVTSGNAVIAAATVGILVGNLYQCTGTLLNDVPADNAPFVLTARHCETGVMGGGAPSNAASLTVYWDATTPCGSALGSIYDPGIATQTGATTVVEEQDAWLVKLDESPIVTDAQFAGFDASGVVVQGGYTIHHALGSTKQLTQWYGQPYQTQQSGVLGSGYLSDFLETVNQLGNIGPGASGSALIDDHDRLVGSLTLGRQSNDSSGYESCPANPAPPNGSNGAADFTQLSAVWDSTADTTVNPALPSLKSALDPGNTGTRAVGSAAAAHLNFTASSYSLTDGDPLILSWNAAAAIQCVAGGGANSDGWNGTLPSNGSQTLTETFGGTVNYVLTCQLSGGRTVSATAQVNWYGSVPYAFLNAQAIVWTGADATLTWSSNVTPCSISGGDLALSNLASSGSITTTEKTPGDVTYMITCGTAPAARTTLTETYVTPALPFRANGTDRRSGEPLWLYWGSYAESCIPAGGAPNDGWTNNSFGGSNEFSPQVTAPGTYTYTLTCVAGPNTVSANVTVTVENNAPYTTSSVSPGTVSFSDSPADYLTIGWKSNLTFCTINSNPNTLNGESSTYPLMPSGASDAEDTATYAPTAPGTFVITVTCTAQLGGAEGSATSAPLTVNVLAPPAPTVTISSNPATMTQGQTFTLSWSSTNAENCMSTGDGAAIGVVWSDSSIASSGSQVETATAAGQSTLGITCQSVDPDHDSVTAQTTVTVGAAAPAPTTASGNDSANSGAKSGGGGGAIETVDTLLLLLLSGAQWRRSRRHTICKSAH